MCFIHEDVNGAELEWWKKTWRSVSDFCKIALLPYKYFWRCCAFIHFVPGGCYLITILFILMTWKYDENYDNDDVRCFAALFPILCFINNSKVFWYEKFPNFKTLMNGKRLSLCSLNLNCVSSTRRRIYLIRKRITWHDHAIIGNGSNSCLLLR